MKNKICGRCNIEKPLNQYYKRKNTPDGYRYVCKKCHSYHKKKGYEKHKKERLEYAKKYREEHPEEVKRSVRNWEKKNPEKKKATRRKYMAKRRRELDYEELFPNPFKGNVHWHHINNTYVVALPEDTHRQCCCGSDRETHRAMLEPIVYEIYYKD